MPIRLAGARAARALKNLPRRTANLNLPAGAVLRLISDRFVRHDNPKPSNRRGLLRDAYRTKFRLRDTVRDLVIGERHKSSLHRVVFRPETCEISHSSVRVPTSSFVPAPMLCAKAKRGSPRTTDRGCVGDQPQKATNASVRFGCQGTSAVFSLLNPVHAPDTIATRSPLK